MPPQQTRRSACPFCRQEGRLVQQQLRDRICGTPGTFGIRECAACDVAWLDHPVADAYGDGYYTHEPAAEALRARVAITAAEATVLKRTLRYPVADSADSALAVALSYLPLWRERCESIALFLPARPGGRLLDVGCGSGVVAAQLRQLGWSVEGIEPDPVAAAVAREVFGLRVEEGTLETVDLDAASYDAVTLNHVIEHVPDPQATLAACARLLRPGGRLVVITPNLRSLGRRLFGGDWMHWDIPRHLFLFSPRSLARLASRAGLEPLEVRTTARAARWVWQRSRQFQRAAVLPESVRPGRGAPVSTAFALLESFAPARAALGEECLLVATVPG